MDRKALALIQRPTRQPKIKRESVIHFSGESTNVECDVGATEGRDGREGGRPASPRPTGLAHARVDQKQPPTASRRRSEPLSKSRWPHGRTPRPAGLGEAGWPHMEASVIPLVSVH